MWQSSQMLLCGLALLTTVIVGAGAVPPGFEEQFRCPFARVWLEHGPVKASEMLGIDAHADVRRLGHGAAGPTQCQIAPGAIGGAHQNSGSPGYHFNCQGTPAQQSPFMWPLRWAADVESKFLKYGSDEVQYHSKGRVMYMLDRNWKRSDHWYQKGTQRTIGQLPCDKKDPDSDFGCIRDSTTKTTVLHRGSKMVFLTWEDEFDGKISNCSWLDLGPVGTIRPDWFLDKRGDSTDVQYLGDSHVFYQGEPKLVKQWRKKDFANQYFTMSMQRIPDKDGNHWPLILNVPGEGFGDDFLQVYTGHRHVEANETNAFLIDEAFLASGGFCHKLQSHSTSANGPPTGQRPHVKSNLEIDAGWRSIVYTASPVWQSQGSVSASPGDVQVTDDVGAHACLDRSQSLLRLSMNFKATGGPVWASIGFRNSPECLMTPRGGGTAEVVMALPSTSGTYTVSTGALSPAVKSLALRKPELKTFTAGLHRIDLDQSTRMHGEAEWKNGQLSISIQRFIPKNPNIFYFTFAMGNNGQLGYHQSRGCFSMANLPECPHFTCAAKGPAVTTTTSTIPRNISRVSSCNCRFDCGVGGSAPDGQAVSKSLTSCRCSLAVLLGLAFAALFSL
eukprot:TRINITY_DN15310_c0_g1_i1.p1 TRINITY_DN15310_c0_g1~~TRINITY_DN15310_c0_g1_i1.p1  ORF type:complete len:615 (-),score=82.13 TRINITY_DN15310_c0_g1_i1:275-2119(-)